MADLFGVQVIEDPYVPEGTFYAITGKNPIDLPPEWDGMTDMEKLSYLVAHGAVVMVRNIETFKATVRTFSPPSVKEDAPDV